MTKAPGNSSPVGLSTSTSSSSVREAGSMASAVRAILPEKFRPGNSARVRSARAARRGGARVRFRHVDEDAQAAGGGQVEQLLARRVGAGVDERADIDIARRDHAVERRVDFLKRCISSRRRTLERRNPPWLSSRAGRRRLSSTSCLATESSSTDSGSGPRWSAPDRSWPARWPDRRAPGPAAGRFPGVSISASSWPAFTCAPISKYQFFR